MDLLALVLLSCRARPRLTGSRLTSSPLTSTLPCIRTPAGHL